MLSYITKGNALRRLRKSLEQEFDNSHVNAMIKRASKYSADDIDRAADAIERFGAQNIFLSVWGR
ncbi:hypothetical protein LAWASA_3751 [Lawsonibacter asaccharolyticus]|nr:hypothetical protein LAWASA_3751 [Lawsonibacter asaccharolyticus]